MNKKGSMITENPIYLVLAIIVLLTVVGFTFGLDFPTKLKNIFTPLNSTIELGDTEAIVGYNVFDNQVYYYGGAEWNTINPGSSIRSGNEIYKQEEFKNEFYNYFYGFSKYSGIRSEFFRSALINREDPANLKNIAIRGIKPSLGERYPEEVAQEKGVIYGEFERLEQSENGFEYFKRLFLVTFEGDFYRTGSEDNFILSGKIEENSFIKGEEGAITFVWRITSISKPDELYDSFTASKLDSLLGLILENNIFYIPDELGFIADEESGFYLKNEDGINWIYFNERKLDAYVTEKAGSVRGIYAGAVNSDSYIKSSSANEQTLVELAIAWRDSIFIKPVEIKGKFYCAEDNSGYLFVRLSQEVEANEICAAE